MVYKSYNKFNKNLHNQAWNRKTVPLEETIQFEEKEEENIFQIVKAHYLKITEQ